MMKDNRCMERMPRCVVNGGDPKKCIQIRELTEFQNTLASAEPPVVILAGNLGVVRGLNKGEEMCTNKHVSKFGYGERQ